MHSGGKQKLPWAHIFIEAPKAEAIEFFVEAFDRDPHNTTCSCCGSDYSVSDSEGTLDQITGYYRSCAYVYFHVKSGQEVPREMAWKGGQGRVEGFDSKYVEHQRFYDHAPDKPDGKYMSLEEFEQRKDILIVHRTKEIGDGRPMQLLLTDGTKED